MELLFILTFFLTNPDGSVVTEDLAVVKDAPTCQALARVLTQASGDPRAVVKCREVKASKA